MGLLVSFGECKKAGWALLHLHLREYFLGKTTSRPGKKAVAGGGASFNSTGNLRPKGWQNINEQNTESGRGLNFKKQFPKLTGNFKQKERFGGFDF